MDFIRAILASEEGRPSFARQLPMMILTVLGLAIYWSGATFEEAPQVDLVVSHASNLTGIQLLLLGICIFAINVLLNPLQRFVSDLLEGYWPGFLGRRIGQRRVKYHQQVLQQLLRTAFEEPEPWPMEAATSATSPRAAPTSRTRRRQVHAMQIDPPGPHAEGYERVRAEYKLQIEYPSEERLLPTALGNVIRAAEDNAGQRYGLDTISSLPLLYPLISEPQRKLMDGQREELDSTVRLSSALLIGGLASGIVLAPHGWWLVVPITLLLFSWIEYRSAIVAAVAYGRSVSISFDLYRFDLLQALHLPLPQDATHERAMNEQVSQAFTRWNPYDMPEYDHGSFDDSGRRYPRWLARLDSLYPVRRRR
jgi:hypothetical protein